MQKKIIFIKNFKKLLLTLNTRIEKLSFIKKFNKLLLTLNTRIESFFNSIKILINTKKKTKIDLRNIDKKILISIGSAVILVFSYFFIPAFYDKNLVKTKLTNQILEKYNLEVNFDGAISYRLFPTPHYFIKDTIIIYDEKNLAKIGFAKIHISIKNFFSFKNFQVKNLNFEKTEFDINSNNFGFFKQILNFNKSKYSINFNDSSLFYRDKYEDVIFIELS